MSLISIVQRRLAPFNQVKYAKRLGVNIGKNCLIISTPNYGSEPWLITIGDHVELTSNISFITHDGSTWVFRDKEKYKNVIRYGTIYIGDNSFVGQGTTFLPGSHVGKGCIIGAGSLVKGKIDDNTVYAGVPAHYICTVEEFAEKCLRETPEYSISEYKKDKKKVVLEMMEKHG